MGAFQACQLAVIVLLAKFAPTDVLGQVRFSLAVAIPILMFCSLELRGALVADVAGEFTFGTYRKLRDVMTALAGLALLGVAVWDGLTERRPAFVLIFVGIGALKLVQSLAEIGWGLFQKRERLDLMAASAILRGAAMLLAFAACVPLFAWFHRAGRIAEETVAYGAALAAAAALALSAALLWFYDRPRVTRQRDHDHNWTWPAVRRLARRTFPLGVVLLLIHLCNSVPEYAIAAQPAGKTALGFFGALAQLTLAGNLIMFQTANAAANRLAISYQTTPRAFARLAGQLLTMAAILGAAIYVVVDLFGWWILRILYTADYAAYVDEFRLIVFAQCIALLTNVFGVLALQMRLFWLQVPAQLLVLAATTLAAWTLIPAAPNPVHGGARTLLVRAVVHVSLYALIVLAGILFRRRLLRRPTRPAERAAQAEPVAAEGLSDI